MAAEVRCLTYFQRKQESDNINLIILGRRPTTGEMVLDKKMLKNPFSGEIPNYVNRSLTVDKRKFLKIPVHEQDELKLH